MNRLALFFLLLLAVGGCATPGTAVYSPPSPSAQFAAPGAAAQATTAARMAEDAQATIAAEQAATAQVVAQQTAVAQATEQARADTLAAEQAAYRATADSLSFQATAVYLSGMATAQALQADATATAQSLRADNVRMVATAEAQRLANERTTELLQIKRQANWNRMIPVILVVSGAFIGLVAFGLFLYRISITPPVQVAMANGREYLLTTGAYTRQPGIGGDVLDGELVTELPALPAPATPRWGAFVNWSDPIRLPIGVDATGQPIFIDRNKEPHLLIAGTTGTGKTSSGLIPYVVGMAGLGVHAIVLNGRGADFVPIEGKPNITVVPQVGRDERPLHLARMLDALVREMDRRDGVLARYGVASWYLLPPHAGESGEILVAIDEFLAIADAARDIDRASAAAMWSNLAALTSEARKFGIFVAMTFTDPTARALGNRGMTVRDQMARVAFGMKNADASRKILGNARGFPDGSVGLPTGHFVANVMGQVTRGAGFFPSPLDVANFFGARHVPSSRLPDALLEAIEVTPGQYAVADGQLPPALQLPETLDLAVAVDAESLSAVIAEMRSLNDVGRFLGGLADGQRPSGQFLDERVKPALRFRRDFMSCDTARMLLGRAGK